MITLFRRVRERLIASGSITKYLLYAIGEILLVVIGILIALQVNNWNENRVEDIQRTELLGQLRSDMENVLTELEGQINESVRKVNVTRRLMNFSAGTETIPADSLQNLTNTALNNSAFTNFNNTFDQAKSSGKFSLIKSDSLLLALNLLEYSIDGYRGTEEYSASVYGTFEFNELVVKADLLKDVDRRAGLPYSFASDMHPELSFESTGPAFLKNPKTYELMYQLQIFNTLQNLWLLNYRQSVEEVIRQIDKELEV